MVLNSVHPEHQGNDVNLDIHSHTSLALDLDSNKSQPEYDSLIHQPHPTDWTVF